MRLRAEGPGRTDPEETDEMAVTLADVAARAGVSAATVSRVLNGNYPVAGSTRERVLRAVDDLDYVVNGHARALAAATSDLVGVLVNDVADPFFGLIASAVQGEISGGAEQPSGLPAGAGKLAVVCNTGGSPEAELNYLTLLERQRAAGVVLTGGAVEGTGHSTAVAGRLARLAASGTRIVLCGRPPVPELADLAGPAADSVMTVAFDNRGGAQRLTEHLLALGHRTIGYVAGPAERSTTRHRLEGHRAALAEAGLAGSPPSSTASPCTATTTAPPATTRRWNCCAASPGSPPSSPPTTRWRSASARRCANAGCASPRTSRSPASTTCPSAWTPRPRSRRCAYRCRRPAPAPGGWSWDVRRRLPAGWRPCGRS